MNLLRRLFSRKPAQPVDRRGWSEDWQVGDVAVCVSANWSPPEPFDPKVGDVLRVSGKYEDVCTLGVQIISCLQFEGKPATHGYQNTAFQKIRPAEQCFTEAMRNLLRTPTPVTPTGTLPLDRDGEGTSGHDARCVNAGRTGVGIPPANCASVAIFPAEHGE